MDVALRCRADDGRAVFDYIDFRGQLTGGGGRAQPHQLRGWRIAEIKQAIKNLPPENAATAPAVTPPAEKTAPADSGNRLFSHFAIPEGDR